MKKFLFEISLIIMLTVFLYHSVKYNMQTPEQTEIAHIEEVKTTSFVKGEVEVTQETETTELYQGILRSAQLDWAWVISPGEFEDLYFLDERYIAVKKRNGKYGVVNENGDFIFSEEYDQIAPYSENMSCVCCNGKYFYIDKDGKSTMEAEFQEARSFQEARAAIRNGKEWGFINPDGIVIIECLYEQVNNFKEGCAAVKQQERWGYIDKEGGVITACQYDEARDYREGFAAVCSEGLWGFLDKSGECVTACQYDEIKDYHEGFAAVKKNDKWGYIDREGRELIPLMYDEAGSFSEGKASVKQNSFPEDTVDKWAYIDQENKAVIDYHGYYAAGPFRMYVGEFHDGLAFVTDVLPSIIDDKGQYVFDGTDSAFFIDDFVYDPKYKAIPAYVFADAAMRERKYGLIRADGNCLLAPVFDHVEVPVDDYVKVAINDDEEKLYGVIQILGQPSGYFEDKVVPVDDMETNKNITENINEEGKKYTNIIAVKEGVNVVQDGQMMEETCTVIENPYFPVQEHISLKVHAAYYDQEFVEETVDAEVDQVKVYENGRIYRFTVFISPMVGMRSFLESDIMSMYFYVTADKIYLLMPYCQLEAGGESIYFYDDDELLAKTFDTEEKLLKYGALILVCQKEEMHGEFFSLTLEGNQIKYYYSETKVNGEQGQRDLFVWEEGKGLVEFGTVYGPGPYEVYIDEIQSVPVQMKCGQSRRNVLWKRVRIWGRKILIWQKPI